MDIENDSVAGRVEKNFYFLAYRNHRGENTSGWMKATVPPD